MSHRTAYSNKRRWRTPPANLAVAVGAAGDSTTKLALVKTVFVTGLTPFHSIEPSPPAQLVTVMMSRGFQSEGMEGLQHLLLDTFSRSRTDGAAILADEWTSPKRHHDA